MTVDNNDPKEWKEKYRRTPLEEEKLTGKEIFQDISNPLKILIVCDKLLTGFDAPVLQAMYLDQRMKEHTLLQSIARPNRPYHRKEYGLVVDYIGVGNELAEALAIFDKVDLDGIFSVDDIKNELISLKEAHTSAMKLFKNVNRDGKPQDIIQQCLEILFSEEIRSDFELLFRKFSKSIDILIPDPCVYPFIEDFKFLGMIREGARNLYRDDRLSLNNCSKKVENLIHAHIIDTGVEQILAPISITAPDFEEKLDLKGNPKAKASHIEYAIRETINSKIGEDPHFYESIKVQLESVLEIDRKRRINEAELLKELVKLKDKEEKREVIAHEKGLTSNEFAFYGLLEPFYNLLFNTNDNKRRQFAKDLVKIIQDEIVVDWTEREDIQKEMRRNIKDQLIKIGLKDDLKEHFTREVIELARERFKE